MKIKTTLLLALLCLPSITLGETDALALMRQVDARAEGETMTGTATLQLIDRRGGTRTQKVRLVRVYEGKDRRSLLFYDSPAQVRGTAFLTYDYADAAREDDQWIYLPALRKPRRVSASDRGDYFLGTDLTYEDLKRPSKVNLDDWVFESANPVPLNGIELQAVKARPVSEAVAKELGYGRSLIYVDPATAMLHRVEFWDLQDRPLKVIDMSDIRQVDGIWTAHRIQVQHHKTGHQTLLEFEHIAYDQPVDTQVLLPNRLERGL